MINKSTAFIISEYNPFHNGHKYHIEQTKLMGADRIICIMSGNFVQRGEPALFDKYTRTRAALLNGADLVLQLPVKYSISNAGRFASGAVDILQACNINSFLSFGASADKQSLLKASDILNDSSFSNKIIEYMKNTGCNYPTAVKYIITQSDKSLNTIFDDPNNTLAVEYIKQLKSGDFCVINRPAAEKHDSDLPTDTTASAKYLRNEIYSGRDIKDYIPDNCREIYSDAILNGKYIDTEKFNTASMSRLLTKSKEDFKHIDNVKQGLENRIFDAVKHADDIHELYNLIKSKRYTHSRIRQIVLSSVLDINKNELEQGIRYINILGFNDKGREILKELKTKCKVPLISSLSDTTSNNSLHNEAMIEYKADAFYGICLKNSYNAYECYKNKPIILKKEP